MMDLSQLFNTLPLPTSSDDPASVLSAIQIPNHGSSRLAKDINGFPVFLIETDQSEYQLAPIILENLTVHYAKMCRIVQVDGRVHVGTYTTIGCVAKEHALRNYFLHVISMLLVNQQQISTAFDVAEAVRVLVELFRALTHPSRESVQGLWAELFLVARAPKPLLMVEAWHRFPDERYDFSYGAQAIEVKSASSGTRQHYFSLEQLQPVVEFNEVLVASMFVRRSEAGSSIKKLLQELEMRLVKRPDLLLHINDMVVKTLGSNWANAFDEGFDDRLARTSLRFFDTHSIPSVSPVLPRGVSNVRFVSDLTNIKPVEEKDYRAKGGLFGAAIR